MFDLAESCINKIFLNFKFEQNWDWTLICFYHYYSILKGGGGGVCEGGGNVTTKCLRCILKVVFIGVFPSKQWKKVLNKLQKTS